jgi:hypothetical protein
VVTIETSRSTGGLLIRDGRSINRYSPRMKRLAVICLIGCSGSSTHPPTAPLEPPAASTACYSGMSRGMGQTARTIARRTIDPAAHQIIEDVSNDDSGAHGAKTFHVVMSVTGEQFTMKETGGAFTGTGTLAGEPWKWTSWTSTSQIPQTTITVESEDELTPTGMTATKNIKQDGKLIGTTTEELKSFDCADWDKAKAALALPALDPGTCDRACRNYATLKFWQRADADIAALPEAKRAAAHKQREADLAGKIDAGVGACATSCLESNNATQTACMGGATSVEQLEACE